jgi:hypothetical protein
MWYMDGDRECPTPEERRKLIACGIDLQDVELWHDMPALLRRP